MVIRGRSQKYSNALTGPFFVEQVQVLFSTVQCYFLHKLLYYLVVHTELWIIYYVAFRVVHLWQYQKVAILVYSS